MFTAIKNIRNKYDYIIPFILLISVLFIFFINLSYFEDPLTPLQYADLYSSEDGHGAYNPAYTDYFTEYGLGDCANYACQIQIVCLGNYFSGAPSSYLDEYGCIPSARNLWAYYRQYDGIDGNVEPYYEGSLPTDLDPGDLIIIYNNGKNSWHVMTCVQSNGNTYYTGHTNGR